MRIFVFTNFTDVERKVCVFEQVSVSAYLQNKFEKFIRNGFSKLSNPVNRKFKKKNHSQSSSGGKYREDLLKIIRIDDDVILLKGYKCLKLFCTETVEVRQPLKKTESNHDNKIVLTLQYLSRKSSIVHVRFYEETYDQSTSDDGDVTYKLFRNLITHKVSVVDFPFEVSSKMPVNLPSGFKGSENPIISGDEGFLDLDKSNDELYTLVENLFVRNSSLSLVGLFKQLILTKVVEEEETFLKILETIQLHKDFEPDSYDEYYEEKSDSEDSKNSTKGLAIVSLKVKKSGDSYKLVPTSLTINKTWTPETDHDSHVWTTYETDTDIDIREFLESSDHTGRKSKSNMIEYKRSSNSTKTLVDRKSVKRSGACSGKEKDCDSQLISNNAENHDKKRNSSDKTVTDKTRAIAKPVADSTGSVNDNSDSIPAMHQNNSHNPKEIENSGENQKRGKRKQNNMKVKSPRNGSNRTQKQKTKLEGPNPRAEPIIVSDCLPAEEQHFKIIKRISKKDVRTSLPYFYF